MDLFRIAGLPGRGSSRGPERILKKLGRTNLAVLLVGEPGVDCLGIARRVHELSSRFRGPCVIVPCELLSFPASDLAGHAQGAWSGAAKGALGYVQKAEGGTLVLDRVDALNHRDQKVLLRIVDGYLRPVGSGQERRIDVRIVATCEDAEKLLPNLRERLAGAALSLPPLRKNTSALPSLVDRFLAGRRRITADALAILACHRWEGNVDELRSLVERIVVESKRVIGIRHLRRHLKTPELFQDRVRACRPRPRRRLSEVPV